MTFDGPVLQHVSQSLEEQETVPLGFLGLILEPQNPSANSVSAVSSVCFCLCKRGNLVLMENPEDDGSAAADAPLCLYLAV